MPIISAPARAVVGSARPAANGKAAPAASAAHGKMHMLDEAEGQGSKLNREWSLAQSIVSPELLATVSEAVRLAAQKHNIEELCLYTVEVPKAQTYLG